VHEALGGTGVWAAQPELIEVGEDGGGDYPILTGDYTAQAATWASQPIPVGRPLSKPAPLFTKLDEALGRTGPSWAPVA
jgi:methionyl-tRNA synthetase